LPIRVIIVPLVGENAINCAAKMVGTGTLNVTDCTTAVFQTIIDKFGKVIFPAPVTHANEPFIAQVFDSNGRSISGIGYTKNLLQKFSLVSEVHAQGIGYTGLTWVQKYWTGFRDISYALLVIIIIVFAFMIMFRVKLSPQTVISVQSALPKVIIAMILVTFSYAIAGFAVDLMYVVSGLFALLLNLAGFSSSLTNSFGMIAGTGAGYDILGGFWVLFMMFFYTVFFFIAAIVTMISTLISGFNLFGVVLGFVFVLIAIWVLILCVIYTFKIPYVLIKTLISLYISIITGPVQILAGAIVPSMGFGTWFKRLMADVMVFPVVGLLFWFAWATLWSAYAQDGYTVSQYWSNLFAGAGAVWPNAWIPGIVGSKGLGVDSGITGILFLGISFSIITLIPKVPDMLKGLFLGEKFAFGTAMGEAYGPIGGAIKTATGLGSSIATGAAAGYVYRGMTDERAAAAREARDVELNKTRGGRLLVSTRESVKGFLGKMSGQRGGP
jgi:hypothetical protein